MKTPLKSIDAQQIYTTRVLAVKEFMDNGHKNINLGLLTNVKIKLQIKMIWYPMVVSFINNYRKYMIPFNFICYMGN